MESLSITPVLALMLPVTGPFILVLLLLLLVRRFFPANPSLGILLSDSSVLAGIFLVFALFDPSALRHFLNPDRPMDWIPLMALSLFLIRNLLFRSAHYLPEMGMLFINLFLLMLPLLRQSDLLRGVLTFSVIFSSWIMIRFLYPIDRQNGMGSLFLLPLFLTASTLSFVSPLSGSLLIGQLSGGVAAVFGAMILAAALGVRVSGIEPGWVTGALLVIGQKYVDIPETVILSMVVILLVGATSGRIVKRFPWPQWRKGMLIVGLSFVPVILAVFETVKALKAQGGGY